jgi:hypothetical protein
MSSPLPKNTSNQILALLGVVALVHSMVHFGTGAIPEAILAILLFLKAFAGRKQPWMVLGVGLFATAITWVVNSGQILSSHLREALSWLGIVALAALAFSRYIFDRQSASSSGVQR